LGGTQAPAAQGVGRHDPLVQAADGEAQVTVVVPSGTALVARHTGTPVLQSIAAVATHAFSRVHGSPWVQAAQAAVAVQTRFVPQLVPGGWLRVVSTQTGVPVVQDVVPVWHGFDAGVQADPAAQGLHAPALQTRFVPQLVPSATVVPAEMHC